MAHALAALLMMTVIAQAQVQEVTRSCLPGFCIESRDAFTILSRDPARGRYRLLVSKTQAVLYLQVGERPDLPHCGALCAVVEEGGETRVRNLHSGRLMGRLIGPMAGCHKDAPFHLYAYIYFSEANPARFIFERACP